MVASAFIVTVGDAYAALGDRNKVRGAVVFAEVAADAKDVLKARFGGDLDALWENATVTAMAAAANMLGWKLQVIVTHPTTAVEIYNVTVTGAGADDTVDELAALMVTALEAVGGADLTPSYNAGTNVLTVAAIADDIGDHQLTVRMFSPLSTAVAIPGFVGTIVDAGASGAVLTAALAADAYTVPAVAAAFKGSL